MADLTFDESAGRFRDSAGRFVSEARVRAAVDAIADLASSRMGAASERLLAGEMSLATWQAEAQATVKLAHLSAATIAHGGAEAMTFSHYGSAGRAIRDQYDYLRQFAADVASGKQSLNGSLTARARQYGQASRVTFEREYGRDQQSRGFSSCRNVIHSGESCSGCRGESARGWVPVGSLVPIGSRICRGNCRCSVSYRREAAEQAA